MGGEVEAKAGQRWSKVCNDQGWNEESQIVHLEGFLKSKSLMDEFATYAEVAAREEDESMAALHGDAGAVPRLAMTEPPTVLPVLQWFAALEAKHLLSAVDDRGALASAIEGADSPLGVREAVDALKADWAVAERTFQQSGASIEDAREAVAKLCEVMGEPDSELLASMAEELVRDDSPRRSPT